MVKAAPYASCVTNNNGTITFYLNENGASATVTFEDGTTNNVFLDVNAGTNVIGTNLLSKPYSFSLTGHSSYAIAVTKLGTGTPSLIPNYIQATNTSVYSGNYVLQGFGDPRGLAVNANPISPYFGRIYVSRGGVNAGQPQFYDMNADGSFSTAGAGGSTAGVAWVIGSPYSSPDKISLAANDDLVVGDYSENNAGVWLVDPNLTTNQLLLGPIGDVNGIAQGVHGAEVGPPVLLGNITNGATLLTVDGDLYTNKVEIYSNITLSALAASSPNGWQNVPDLTGPQVAINLPENPSGPGYYFFPSLQIGANGYLYSGEYRYGIGSGDYAFVQVYDRTFINQLWNSRYNSGSSDYFYTEASGGNAKYSPTSVSVSPDGKYLATVATDNHITLCLLTNGIPNVSTISTIAPVRFYNNTGTLTSDGGDEIAWDGADNMYVLSASDYGLTTWTLGQSATYTTYGNANGVTNFVGVTLTPSVSVYATNATVISEPNTHGNPTNTVFTLVRSGGNPGAPLTANFTYGGTAPSTIYKVGSSASVVFAAGQTVTNITVYTVSDTTPRLTTYLTLNVSSSMNYNVGNNSATISIMNTATPELEAAAGLTNMYNAFSNDYCSMVITRLGDTNTSQTVTFSVSGTAVEGTDYTPPTTVTFNSGDLTHTTYIYPLVGGQIPTHNPNLPYTGNKTAVIGLSAGSGYTVTTTTATMTIVDSASPAAHVLFFDPLTNALDATNWGINAANGNLDNLSPNTTVQFGMNLYNTPSYPIPAPPNGATNALMITVNKAGTPGDISDNPMTAVNAYFTNQLFSGNYAVRFNMNILQGDSTTLEYYPTVYPYSDTIPYDAEEGPVYGIDTSGAATNWFAGNLFALGDTQTNFVADGVWYFVSDNGGDLYNTAQYLEFTGFGPLPNTGWTNVAVASSSAFATEFKTNVFTAYSSAEVPPNQGGWAEGGPGLVANGPPSLVGSNPNAWSDVEVKQLNGIVTMCIDKTPIFVYTNVSSFTNGMLMLGYEDPYFGNESADTAVYFSNLRVVALTPPAITSVSSAMSQFTFKFTTPDDTVTTSSFKVLGATAVNGPYSAVSGATVTQSNGVFQASVPTSTGNHFYRIQQM